MGTTPKNKAIDAEYLLNQLKNLDKNILETKYVQEKDVKDTYTATDENPISGKGVSAVVNTLQQDINGKSNIGHKHTKSEITDFPTSMPPTAHTHDDRYYTESEINTKLNSKLNTSLKGSANGLAELDANGKVPSSQLPSFVDDIIEGYLSGGKFYKESAHTTEITGETGKIYIDLATNKTYRWSGSAFVVVSETLALGETSSTAYRGDRGKVAYDHSQSTHARTDATKVEKSSTNGNIKINGTETTVYTHPSGTNPHGTTKSDVGLGNVGNFKAVSTVANQGLTEAEKSNARANIGAGVSSFSGSYNDLTNKPTIPTNTNQLTNGAGYITSSGTAKTISDTLPISKGGTGQTTGENAANALINSLGEGTDTPSDNDYYISQYASGGTTHRTYYRRPVSALWNYIKSKLATVATSGSYNDLKNKPTIPSVGNGTVTIKQAGASKGTFTMNQSGNTTIELTDNNTTYGVATQSTNGLESAADKKKLDGIATGAEVNQNAFSNVVVGSTTIAADSKTDTLTLAGSNVTITPDATNDKVTIGITKANVTSALGYTPPTTNTTYGVATSSALGLVKSGTDITVDSSGNVSVNDDSHNHVISNVDGLQSALNAKKPSEPTTFSLQKDYIAVRTANRTASQYYEFWDNVGWADIHAGSITAHENFIGKLSGNAATATKLATARTISLTGSVTGSGSFDGSGNLSIATTTNHTHNYLPLSGGTVTGPTQFNNYLKLNAWSGYGTGTANFWYDANNKFVEIQNVTDLKLAGTKVSKEGHTHTELMSKNNPTGTGSFSLNRKAGSTVGSYSHAEGYNTVASGDGSHAEGRETNTTGYYSHAEGCSSIAKGNYSHAEGLSTIAKGSCSHAEGYGTNSFGDYSHAEGYYTTATGSSAVCHAEGYKTLASGKYSHAEGSSTNSYGESSHAEGEYTTAKGIYSHAEGYRTNAVGAYSHAEGRYTTASYNAHAEGCYTNADSDCAHAEGAYSTAGVAYSHAEGYYCSACGSSGMNDGNNGHAGAHAGGSHSTAGGTGSFAHGNYVVARSNQLVIGHYNKRGTSWKNGTGWYSGQESGTGTSTAFLIGNGTSSSQSNAMRADYNGKLWCLQAYSATGADYAELFEWEDGNKNNEDRRGYFVTLDGINIKKATSTDDYILGVISAAPTVIGNGDDEWSGRYLRDKFGSFITVKEQEEKIVTDNYIDENGDIQTSERVVTYEYEHYKENPEYDPNREYVDRIHRPEWDAVGMMGVLIVRQDGTAIVNKYVCSNDEGIATLCEKKECSYRVVEVIDNETIKILIK